MYTNKPIKLNFTTIILIFVLTFFLSNVSFGQNAKYLNQGQVAPFSGMLLDNRLELKARTAIVENEKYREILENQYEMINTLHQSNMNKQEQIATLYQKIDSDNTFERVLYFFGGVLVGGIVANQVTTYGK